jgi:hypothetical protein
MQDGRTMKTRLSQAATYNKFIGEMQSLLDRLVQPKKNRTANTV